MSEYYEEQAKLAEFAIANLRKVMKDERAKTSDIENALTPLKQANGPSKPFGL